MSAADAEKDRFIEIWRGISIFLVAYYHYTDRIPFQFMGATHPPLLPFFSGKIGVYIFFVISGFLIAKSLDASKSLADFYAKRISRIWPLFIAASIIIFLALQVLTPPIVPSGPKMFFAEHRSVIDLFGTIFFLEDLGFNWIDGVFWSILVELKYYLYIGLIAAVFKARGTSVFAWISVVLAAIDMAVLLFVGDGAPGIVNRLLHGVLIAQYLPFFAVGMLLYRNRFDSLFIANAVLCVTQIVLVSSKNPSFEVVATGKFLLAFSVLLLADSVLLSNRIFLFLGAYSYSIYLFHQMIGLSIIKLLAPKVGYDLAICGGAAIVILISWGASKMFEWRYRRLLTTWLLKTFALLKLERVAVVSGSPKELGGQAR